MLKVLTRSALATIAAIAISHCLWLITDAERRCAETLELDANGFVCSSTAAWMGEVAILGGLGIVVGIPLSLAVRGLIRRGGRAALTGRALAALPLLALSVAVVAQMHERAKSSYQPFVLDDLLGFTIPVVVALLPVWQLAFVTPVRDME